MSLEFLKALLNVSYYTKHKAVISENFIAKDYQELYHSIVKSHEENKVSLTVDELKALHNVYHPMLTLAKKTALEALYTNLKAAPVFDEKVQDSLIEKKLIQIASEELALTALKVAEGQESEIDKLQTLLDKIKNAGKKKEQDKDELIDIDDLFDDTEEFIWKFNYPDLQKQLGGLGPGYFGVIAARTDTGKTAFHIALTAMPGGWIEQGAKVHLICNEEAPKRIKKRIVSSITGWTNEELKTKREEAKEVFASVRDNIRIIEGFGMTMGALDHYCGSRKVDILIIDQLDKLNVNGKHATNEERLKQLYIQAREIAKRHNCAVIGICQASFAAHNKLHYGFECLEGSKTGKASECDFVITLGMQVDGTVGDNYYRMINLPKNKLTGKKSPIPFMLQPDISRIHA